MNAPYYVLIIILLAANLYSKQFPPQITAFIHSIWGIITLIILIVGSIQKEYMVIAGLLFLLYFRTMPKKEGFVPGDLTNHHLIDTDHRWFIEKLMKERPYIIEDSVVSTDAVQ